MLVRTKVQAFKYNAGKVRNFDIQEEEIMRPYAGYDINFGAFWKYYDGAVKVNYSQYRTVFVRCFCASEKKYGLSEGYGSNHVNLVGDKLTPICQQTRIAMLSNGVPDAAIKHIITHFKKWFNSYYA